MHTFTFSATPNITPAILSAPSTRAKVCVTPPDAYVDAVIQPGSSQSSSEGNWVAIVDSLPQATATSLQEEVFIQVQHHFLDKMVNLKPPKYVLASVAASLGGLANGLDTGCIGGIINMPQFKESVGHLSAFMLGFTVSLIMLTGVIPSVFAGHLADRFGRLKIIQAGSLAFIVGLILQGSATSIAQFSTGRAITGLGQGLFLGNISVYICEIAPATSRGMLSSMPQFMATAGVCWGYFLCYGSAKIASSMAWRLGFIFQGINATSLTLLCFLLPESPRWLLLHGRRPEALRALHRLQFSMVEAERDFLAASTEQRPSLSLWQGFILLFRRGYRARTILALFLLGMVQLSGIDGVVYYAPILFSQAGISSNTASFLASGVSAILMLVISIPALLFADKWGSLYAARAVHPDGAARWVVVVSVFVFGLTYCATWGIVGKIYASEIQPSNTRGAANCLAMSLSFLTNWIVAILTPILLDKSAFAAYFLFGGLALGTTAVLAAYMPETRGRSLENIQQAFHRPALKSLSHYLKAFTPEARQTARVHETRADAYEGVEMQPMTSGSLMPLDSAGRGLRVSMAST
ncbi:hypothetical protein NM208_g4325 [Fusarium decemcellulare]|uniref:Uncharacterized protein n=1 Tax=Fusarium decemcellulare TaxID=57161 RepID=A0ACC1SL24_9HYPO|nr:hypothetical protein NM208_g4325 [Fusarium decemcellulare]